MKHRILIKPVILIIAIASLFIMGCKKSEKINPNPVITEVSTLAGLAGSSVTITGRNFGTDLTRDTVRFNGAVAIITSASTTFIVVTVPANATTGKISVTTNGKTLVYPTDFNVKLPVPTVSNVKVIDIVLGSTLFITGNNFNPDATKNTVQFGGVTATIISASTTQLIAEVLTTATTGQVTVTAYGTTLTYPTSFNLAPYTYGSLGSTAIGYLAADVSGNIYGEWGNAVLKISALGDTGTLATIGAGGTLLKGTTVDPAGNVYASGNSDHKIYKITAAGVVSTFAGSGVAGYSDGQGKSAQFIAPVGMTIDASGNLYVCDSARVRKITPAGLVSTFAGSGTPGDADGLGQLATFSSLIGITADHDGNLFVINLSGTIRKITANGQVTTLNLQGRPAGYNNPVSAHGIAGGTQITADPFGNLFVCSNYGIIYGTQNANAGVEFPVYIINQSGLVTRFTTGSFVSYLGITTDSSGKVYVSQKSTAYDGAFITSYSFK